VNTDADRLRKAREQSFHDERFADEMRHAVGKYYSVDAGKARYQALLRGAASEGQRVLEYGCGTGSEAFDLAASGAIVSGIDISGVAIAKSREEAMKRGVVAEFQEMDAEELNFREDSFDVVCGSGILHHLDLGEALPQIARVLASDGTAVFMEPLGHNPIINAYRWLTPKLRTSDEHPLLMQDFESAEGLFGSVELEFFNLTSLVAVPLRGLPGGSSLLHLLRRLDGWLFDRSAIARRWAWVVVIRLSSPAA
jgi:SAM-dependent methyltransferase